MAATRRLAAILAADVVGYSRLIGADEPGTLQRLRAIRAEVIDPAVEQNNGRIVKTTGDGLLISPLRMTTSLVMASISRRGSKRLPQRAAYAFRPGCRKTLSASSTSASVISASSASII